MSCIAYNWNPVKCFIKELLHGISNNKSILYTELPQQIDKQLKKRFTFIINRAFNGKMYILRDIIKDILMTL